jgi:hypothetical protein
MPMNYDTLDFLAADLLCVKDLYAFYEFGE